MDASGRETRARDSIGDARMNRNVDTFRDIRLGVTGGRDYGNAVHVAEALNELHKQFGIAVLVEGGAHGLDTLARFWAKGRRIAVETHPADWDKHGKAAGPIRNEEMANAIDALAVFPGGRGTADMRRRAERKGLPIYEC